METITWLLELLGRWYWVPMTLALVGVFLTVLIENRNPAKATSYLLLLVILPIIGLVVFYFFGRDFRKQLKFKKKASWEKFKTKEFWEEVNKTQQNNFSIINQKYGQLSKIPEMLFNQKNSLTLGKNKVTPLKNGEEKFPEVFESLRNATHHIHIEYYIIANSDVSDQLLEILIEKAKQGVEVRVFVDGLGSRKLKGFANSCKSNNIAFHVFMPVRFSNLASSNYRDHSKIIVIDGKIGYIGGINFNDKYWNRKKRQLYWRDTHLKIEGPSVNSLQFRFMTSWKFVSKEVIPFEKPYFFNTDTFENGSFVSIVTSGPLSPSPYGMDTMVSLMYQAKKNIRIANPYFIPSDELNGAIINAAHSGIKVQLLIPGSSDSHIAQRATISYLKRLVENNVEVFLYKKGFVHSKTLTIDDEVSFVGSLNADMRSFYINFEASALVFDQDLTTKLNDDFDQDLKDSEKFTLEKIKNRSITDKFLDSVCRLLTPIL
jgi:cardiolipin synthase